MSPTCRATSSRLESGDPVQKRMKISSLCTHGTHGAHGAHGAHGTLVAERTGVTDHPRPTWDLGMQATYKHARRSATSVVGVRPGTVSTVRTCCIPPLSCTLRVSPCRRGEGVTNGEALAVGKSGPGWVWTWTGKTCTDL
jgi:hypothetical protein